MAEPAFPPPRMGTERRADLRPQTLGAYTDKWHRLVMRKRLMPWNRYIADVLGELDPATGMRWYDAALVKAPRQQGKSWWVRAHLMATSRRPEMELDPATGLWVPAALVPRRMAVYTAQDRGKAREQIITELLDQQLDRCEALRGQYHGRRAQGSERITWRDTGGRIQVESSNDTAAHGLTVDDAVLDEAFAHEDLTIVNAIEPTMLTKPDPLIVVTSTPGDGTDGLMLYYEEVAAAAIHDPDTHFAVFDWSADEDDDRADPEVWRRVMPALGHTITEQRVRNLLGRTPPAEFDRAYLARRPTTATVAAIDPAAWARGANPDPDRPLEPAGAVVLAVDLDPDRRHANVALVWALSDGRLGAIVHREPGTRWVVPEVERIANSKGITVFETWGDRRAGVGGIMDQLAGRGRPVHEMTAGDVASACGDLYDLTRDGLVVHDDQPELNDAVTGSRRRPLGEAWALDKLNSTTDQAPLNAVAMALAGFRHHFPTGTGAAGGIR